MSTTTIEEQLAKIRQRVASLRVRLHADGRAERPRIERHLDALHQEEESLRGAARKAPDEVEERLGRLKTRLDVAEHALAADSSRDWDDLRRRRRGGAPQLGHVPRAAADERRVEGVEGARAGRGSDRKRSQPPDRGRRAPRGGA